MSTNPNSSIASTKRWQVLEKTIETMQAVLPSGIRRRDVIDCLYSCLRVFGSGQFDYASKSSPSESEYPTPYAQSLILRQISEDLEVIERTAAQRCMFEPQMQITLDKADWLTAEALRPAMATLKDDKGETTVLTYFQKSPAIRVTPYAPVALIGIPFTCTRFLTTPYSATRDFLAIPHEVGHYVFWHGMVCSGEYKGFHFNNALEIAMRKDRNFPKWCLAWIEEIFADVYGCLIAGPLIALDFQELQKNRSLEEFTHDDGEHPVPLVRPEIYTRTLEKMGQNQRSAELKERWTTYLNEDRLVSNRLPKGFRADLLSLIKSDLSNNFTTGLWQGLGDILGFHWVWMDRVRQAVGKVVDEAYDLLKDIHQVADSNWWKSTYIKIMDEPAVNLKADDQENVFELFEQDVNSVSPSNEQLSSLRVQACDTEAIWSNRSKKLREENQKIQKLLVELGLQKEVISPQEALETEWRFVLNAGGWTTEGPEAPWP